MQDFSDIMKAHPGEPVIDVEAISACIEECYTTAASCTACADACLGEDNLSDLVHCITVNQDCSDICLATARVLGRQTSADLALMRSLLAACISASRRCAEECNRHSEMHEHCKICADACTRCEDECNGLLLSIPVFKTAEAT